MALDLGSAVGYLLLDTSSFKKGLTTASQDMQTFFDKSTKAGDKMTALSSAMRKTGSTLTKTVTLPLVGLGTVSVKTAATFESAMSQVQATMGLTADSTSELKGQTVNTMDSLSSLAKQMGAETKFSATEAAEAINNMAMAGYDVNEVYAALPEVLNLASAGALDLDYATQLAANGLNVMGYGTDRLSELSNKLAVTASSAYGSVSDFGEGLLVAGGAAKSANLNFTDIFTALGILGDAGISASEGGTKLRNVILSLYAPTDTAAEELKTLGIQTKDADGNVRNFQDVLKDLSGSLDGLSESDRLNAINTIFNKADIAGVNALLSNCTDRWDELSSTIDNAGDAAEQMSDTQLDNLNGQLTILMSGLEGLAIAFGEALLPLVKDVTAFIQSVVTWLNNLNDEQIQTITKVLEFAAALGPILLIGSKVVAGLNSIVTLITNFAPLVSAFGSTIAGLAAPILAVIAIIVALKLAWDNNFGGMQDKLTEFADTVTDRVTVIANFLQTVFTAFMGVITELWNSNWMNIRLIFEDVWNAIETIFSSVIAVLTNAISLFLNVITGNWSGAWENIKAIFGAVWDAIVSLLNLGLDSILNLFGVILPSIGQAATNAWNAIKTAFVNVWNAIMSWFKEAIHDPEGTILGIADALFNAGASIFTSLWNGLKSIWSSITSWVSDCVDWITEKVTFWQKQSDKVSQSSGSTNGSHASGLDYVPFDGYRATLHQGERVLTQEENKYYNSGYRSGGDTFNFYSPEAIDAVTAAREFKKVQRQLAEGVS